MDSEKDTNIIQSCKHEWECLRKGRVHGKTGKGNYQAYKCKKCNAFQRRPVKK